MRAPGPGPAEHPGLHPLGRSQDPVDTNFLGDPDHEPQGKQSRLDQIVAWLAGGDNEDDRHAFSSVIVFDEAHAMANAAGSKGSRGDAKPSQQGRAGLRLQNALPDARVLYVSATGATTVPGLAYARRGERMEWALEEIRETLARDDQHLAESREKKKKAGEAEKRDQTKKQSRKTAKRKLKGRYQSRDLRM